MKFIKNWKIETNKVPAYTPFKKEFIIDVDYKLLQMMSEKTHTEITEDRLKLLRPLLQAINPKTNKLKVSYYHPFNLGRFYPKNSLSPINVSRHFKHTLFHYMNWIDVDMVRGHASILFSIAKNNNLHLPTFELYLTNRDKVINDLLLWYGGSTNSLNEKDIKDIFNITIYGGGHSTWVKQMAENNKEILTTEIHPIEKAFVSECRMIMETIYNSNPDIIEKVKGEETNEYKIKCKVMAYFCGTIENEILFITYNFLCERGIIKNNMVLLEYDGLCFPNPNIDNLQNVVDELNYIIREKTKLNVKMAIKKYDEEYLHHDIIEQRKTFDIPVANAITDVIETEHIEAVNVTKCNDDNLDFYSKWKKEFELNHFKVINKSFFMKIIKDDLGFIVEMKMFSKTDIISSYEHITFIDYSGLVPVTKPCIKEWINDKTMRVYEDIKMIPPPLKCPDNIYNLWTPFYAEKLLEIFEWKFDDITEERKNDLIMKRNAVIHHIRILSNHNETDFVCLVRWIGQMLKYPALKTICITLISEEGAGKGTLIYLLQRLMGEQKVFETSSPEERVWGKFNSIMMDAFFVNCNELEFKVQQEAESKIKTLITDTKGLVINEKNVKAFKMDSYHRFIFTSNKLVPLKTHSNDRRNKIIRSSDELCHDKEYFKKLRSYIDDNRVLLLVYQYFIELENLDTFHLENIQHNQYQQALAESFNKSVPELFLEQLTMDNYDGDFIERTNEDILMMFNSFKSKYGHKYEGSDNGLIRTLKILKIPEGCITSRRTRTNRFTIFNIGLLKDHFKLTQYEEN